MEKSVQSKGHRLIDTDDDSSLSNKRLKTDEPNENIEPDSESSNEHTKRIQLKLVQSSARRPSKASPVAINVLREMGLDVLDSDESSQSSVWSNLGQSNAMVKSVQSEVSSEPMSNLMTGANEICIESDSNPEGGIAPESQSPTSIAGSTDDLATSAEKTYVGAQAFSIHQDFTPANLIPVSRTNFAGIVNPPSASGPSAASSQPEGRAIRNTSLKKFNEHESNSAKKHKGRSPLATVSNNANANICRVHCPTLSDADVAKKTVPTGADEDSFFMYKRQDPRAYTGDDNFQRLSDEMILSVFKWLPKKALMRCSLVNHRFHRVALDETLWTRLDLSLKTIQPHALGRVVSRGVIILRLAQCKILEPLFKPAEIPREFHTKLQFLDLSMASITTQGLLELFSRCRLLKKLSLEHVEVNEAVCKELANNKQMEVLNLAMCRGITAYGIRKIVRSMKRLQALNISWTSLDEEAVAEFTNYITENIVRLNISGCRKTIEDRDVQQIISRCPRLRELDLSDCTMLTMKTIDIVSDLEHLEYLSLSRCYNINVAAYLKINQLNALSFLDIFGVLSEQALAVLQSTFPDIGINKFYHSAIARPTVGTRRTSIWGLRTRD